MIIINLILMSTVGDPFLHLKMPKILQKGPCKKRAFSAKKGHTLLFQL